MTDELTDIYGDAEPRLVIRLSRTAAGVRTYTVGASVPLRSGDTAGDAEAITRVFAVDDLVRDLLDHPHPAKVAAADRALAPTLALSLAAAAGVGDNDGWYTGEALAAKMGVSRRTLQRQIGSAISTGTIECRRGGGKGKPTLYRVAAAPTDASVPA